MKKQSILLTITIFFIAFTFGFFIGRNQNHESIHLSVLPERPLHNAPPATITLEETSAAAICYPININSADLTELSSLPGIGDTLARRILQYRELNGTFETPEELLNVDGIGAGKLEAILEYIITGG